MVEASGVFAMSGVEPKAAAPRRSRPHRPRQPHGATADELREWERLDAQYLEAAPLEAVSPEAAPREAVPREAAPPASLEAAPPSDMSSHSSAAVAAAGQASDPVVRSPIVAGEKGVDPDDPSASYSAAGSESTGAAGGELSPPAALSLDEARRLVLERYNLTIGDGDPLVMLVAILEGTHDRHVETATWFERRMQAQYAAATTALHNSAQEIVAGMRQQSSAGAADAITSGLEKIAHQAGGLSELMTHFKAILRKGILILSVLAALCWLAVGAMYLVVQ